MEQTPVDYLCRDQMKSESAFGLNSNCRVNADSVLFLSFFLPIRLNLRGGHQTGFGMQVQRGGGVS